MTNNTAGKVTIIIPAFNAERYIAECLESILQQSYTDWEAIIIDDGSRDRTGSICEDYSARDNRIRLISKENGGVSSARNKGLDEARGEFVIFVDADDLLPKDSLSLRMKAIGDADLLSADMDEVDEQGAFLRKSLTRSVDSVLDNKNAIRIITVRSEQGYQGYSCNKLFRREIIEKNHIRFHEKICYNEDRLFCYQYVSCCRKVRMLPEVIYHYRQIRESASHQQSKLSEKDAQKALTEFDAFDLILDLAREQCPETFFRLSAEAQYQAIKLKASLDPNATHLCAETGKRIYQYGMTAVKAPREFIPLKQKAYILCHAIVKQ